MKKDEYKEQLEGEFIKILAEQFGVSMDTEAVEILRDTVFGANEKELGE